MRKASQLLKDLAVSKLRAEMEPRGRAENRRVEAARLARETSDQEQPPGPSATLAIAEPTSYKKAMEGHESSEWSTATKKEIDSLTKNGTWELISRQPCMEVIGSS